jgi:uncharacterized protein (TIRG00374 family)
MSDALKSAGATPPRPPDDPAPPLLPRIARSQLLLALLGFAITAVFIYLIVAKVDVHKIGEILSNADLLYVVLGFVALALAYVFRTLRLHFIIAPHATQVSLATCAKAILVGVALNNIYPFRLGDLYRVVAFRRSLGIDGAKMLAALAIERVIDLSLILVFLALALGLLPSGAMPEQLRFWGTVLMAAAIVAFVTMLFTPSPLRYVLGLFRPHNAALRGALRFADSMLEGVASAVTPRSLAVILALAAVGWTIEVAVLSWVAAKAIGLGGSYAAPLLGLVLSNLSTLIPSSPGYVGTFDYFSILGITSAGGEANQAAAFALLTHVTLWVFTTAAGLALLAADWYRRTRTPRLPA